MNLIKIKFIILILLFNITLFAKNELTKVSIQLSWFDQFQFAGYYMAKEKGIYEKFGLDVEIKPFNYGLDTASEVNKGNIDFAVGRETLILEKVNRKNDLVILYALFQSSPLVLLSKKSSNIKTVKDFENKRIMTTLDDANEISLKAMVSSSNIDTKTLKLQKHSHDINDLINDNTDLISAYISKSPYLLKKKGIKYNIFEPKNYGFDMYSDFLYTSKKLVSKNKNIVKAFKKASLNGWKYAYSNINESVDLIHNKYNSQNLSKDELLFEAKELKKLSYLNTYNLGDIKESKLNRIYDLYKVMGLINYNVKLNDFIFEDTHSSIFLNDKEENFIINHPKIIIASDKTRNPYIIENQDGSISGFDSEVLHLINKVSGANFVLKTGKGSELENNLKNKKIDGFATSIKYKERESFANFSNKYLSLQKMIIVTKDNPNNINKISDLLGKTLVINKNNLLDMKIVKRFKNIKVLEVENTTDIIKALVLGKADAAIGELGIFYYANRMGLPYLKPSFLINDKLEHIYTIRKDWPEAIGIINKSLDYIGEQKLLEIKKKWLWDIKDILLLKNNEKLFLNEKEKKYLREKVFLKACTAPDIMPYGKFNSKKELEGISKDIIDLISSKTYTQIKAVPTSSWKESLAKIGTGECDILPIAINVKSRFQKMNFTFPYLMQPLVIATGNDELFIKDARDIGNRKVGVFKDSAVFEMLKSKYPNLNIVLVKNPEDGLRRVNNKELFGYIDSLVSVAYNIKKTAFYNLKIAGRLEFNFPFSVASRNDEPILNSILEKVISVTSKEEKEELLNDWLSIKFEKDINYDLVWEILGSFLLVLLVLTIFFIKQNKLRNEIVDLNRTLEIRVREEVEKNREKDNALFRQSKLASMGEMIGNIAHQWRQPLNRINLSLSVITMLVEKGEFDKKMINDKVESAEKNIKYMSDTIEDFINFFRPDKKITDFCMVNTIERCLKLLEGRISDIKFTVPKERNIKIRNYENEFLQVLLIILNNAIDNFAITKVENKKIHISLLEYRENIKISVMDNSGGIAQENLEKIFEPYFTTKFKKEGTGLGLYMAKMVVEKSMNGKLNVSSINKSSTFVITLEKKKEEDNNE
ncbi:ABC transporter substrate-binding protein [Poseidonibacter lekithochrous]|uniref:ABC transporter substrate-binding protein n=1 Tax=Poseidonibacter lekithochrous TaxID=1904463 RepID=UPI000D3519FE|nr:transporter substrate-binding domain-containing protein [Poseidonibacter lekithochrous]